MQHAVERALRQRGRDLRRKARGLDGAIDHRGAHGQAGLREITGRDRRRGPRRRDRAAARRRDHDCVRTRSARSRATRSPLSPSAECTSRKPTARAASAVRRPTVNAGSAVSCARRGWSAMARAALALVSTTALNALVRERERDRLGAQQRRQHDGVAARAQGLRGALAVGLRPGDEEPHASHRREEIGAGARLELGRRHRRRAPPHRRRRRRARLRPPRCRRAWRSGRESAARPHARWRGPRSACGRSRRAPPGRRARSASAVAASRSLTASSSARVRASSARASMRDDPLPDRRQEFVGRQDRGGGVGAAQPLEPGERQQRGVDLAGVELAQARLHVAAKRSPPQDRGAAA